MNKNIRSKNNAVNNDKNTQTTVSIEEIDAFLAVNFPMFITKSGKFTMSEQKRREFYVTFTEKQNEQREIGREIGQSEQSEKADNSKRSGKSKITDQNYGLIGSLLRYVVQNDLVDVMEIKHNNRTTFSFIMDRDLVDKIGLKLSYSLLYTKQDMSYGENYGRLFYRYGVGLTDCTPLTTEYGIKSVVGKSDNGQFQSFCNQFGFEADKARQELARVNRWRLTFDVFTSHENMQNVFKLVKRKEKLPKSFDKLDVLDFPTEKIAQFTDDMDAIEKLRLLFGIVDTTDTVDSSNTEK